MVTVVDRLCSGAPDAIPGESLRAVLGRLPWWSFAYAVFDDSAAAAAYVRERGAPIVVKADGLAAGKGVVVAETRVEAKDALRHTMVENLFGAAGEHSPRLEFDDLRAVEPDILIFMPCGYDLMKTVEEAEQLLQAPTWAALAAVRDSRAFAVDGNAYFNRPGPRLVESVEILAEICHPESHNFGHEGSAWRRLGASPETDKAAKAEDGPGMGDTLIPAS